MKRLLLAGAASAALLFTAGCLPDAQVANQNLTTEADNFKRAKKKSYNALGFNAKEEKQILAAIS